ncbi:DUF547 domain-containing protein [Hymenobacter sp. BT683]|uniref:DUF547 domain-containing protein n=1 Tax=Hymenobacter jeongseonensis TaxID=2791027 RepID=A0ABS0IGY5_9BACT|nr:DUF547 domain-containing protein [Hymenobacter jeongseonensis]MBF9237621.1 DUF547 domain-containing protein [Hymenobacter jeongseonensis]
MKSLYNFGMVWAVVLWLLSLSNAAAQQAPSPTVARITAQTNTFLHKYVNKSGKVDYAGIQVNPQLLDELLTSIADFDAGKTEVADQYAFYLNAYNILVIGEIVRNYPLRSVQEMPGFFNKTLLSIAGERLTLDQIELDKLRKIYDDPRLHFALVCGTSSCPRLSRTAYIGKQLFVQLNNQARFAMLDPSYVKVDEQNKLVRLPEIFKWYETDFSASGKTGVSYVNQFRKDSTVPTWFSVVYYPYNWSLNDQKFTEEVTAERAGR